jgi:hypothetical protein
MIHFKSIYSIYYKIRFGKPIIVVSGLPRSGTSMIMQMLEAGGLEIVTDHIRKTDDDNPKGYYELERVKDLDKENNKGWLGKYKGKAIKIISFLLRDLPVTLNYKVIFIERCLDEILLSQNKMLINRGENGKIISDQKMKKNYENHLWRVKYFLKNTPNFDTLYINFRDVIQSPKKQALQIYNFLNSTPNMEAMARSVDKKLYRNRL